MFVNSIYGNVGRETRPLRTFNDNTKMVIYLMLSEY